MLCRVDLELIKRTGNEHQQWMASKVEPLLTNPHWLLCSLLLLNAGCYETLPIFLDRLLNPVAAILISVSAILIFGEILPQAVCRKYSLQIGAYSSWPVRFVMIITAPISWPLGKCLDWLLGYESALFRRAELRELVTLHAEPDEDGGESMLTAEEVQVIHGALDMAHKTAETAMTPLANVYALSADAILDRKLLESIISAGHSRIPVYEGDDKRNIIGLILVKLLILRDTTKSIRIRDCLLREVDFIVADTPLYSVLELFRLKRRHMAVLTKSTGELDGGQDPSIHIPPGDTSNTDKDKSGGKVGEKSTEGLLALPTYPPRPPSANGGGLLGTVGDVIGILTLEDIFEELLAIEIADETDQYMDNEKTIRVPPLKPELPPKLSRYLSWGRKQGQAQSASHNGQGPSTRASPTKQYGVGSGNEHNDAVIAAAAGAAFAAARQNNAHQRRASGGVSARDADAAAAVAATDVTAHPLPPSASNGGGGGGAAPGAGAPAVDKVEKKPT